jgi:hypothetical protein
VTGLALIHEVLRVQTDLRVIAVHIVEPYLMVYYQTRLIVAYLAQPAVQRYPCIDIA